jgi:hypothetical protein
MQPTRSRHFGGLGAKPSRQLSESTFFSSLLMPDYGSLLFCGLALECSLTL